MDFVKSIMQQWREKFRKNAPASAQNEAPAFSLPNADTAEQHLLESLARQINDAVVNEQILSDLNIEEVYENLAEALSRFKQESYNLARQELSEKWSEEEAVRLAEIKKLQEQIDKLLQEKEKAQKYKLSTDRVRQMLTDRIRQLETELTESRDAYEHDIEEKLRQINKIKAQSLGLLSEGDMLPESNEKRNTTDVSPEAKDEEKIFDCGIADEESGDAVVVRHRYASLYNKLCKAQNALQDQRKENRNMVKRDTRHRQRIKELQETIRLLRKELEQIRQNSEMKNLFPTSGKTTKGL